MKVEKWKAGPQCGMEPVCRGTRFRKPVQVKTKTQEDPVETKFAVPGSPRSAQYPRKTICGNLGADVESESLLNRGACSTQAGIPPMTAYPKYPQGYGDDRKTAPFGGFFLPVP
jgi:hypothetical protein